MFGSEKRQEAKPTGVVEVEKRLATRMAEFKAGYKHLPANEVLEQARTIVLDEQRREQLLAEERARHTPKKAIN